MGKISIQSIKGRIAEAIVEELFLAMGYEVFRYGMENTMPGFGSRRLPKSGDVATKIRQMPDYVIVKNQKSHFVEVKFRSSGKFDLTKYCKKMKIYPYPYTEAYFILVSPGRIKIQKAENLMKGDDFVYFNEIEGIDVEVDIVRESVEIIKSAFSTSN